jgi:hypothetical protein
MILAIPFLETVKLKTLLSFSWFSIDEPLVNATLVTPKARHEFETLAKQHHSGRAFRTASRWSQFVCLSMAQLTGRNSLRDVVENVSAQAGKNRGWTGTLVGA